MKTATQTPFQGHQKPASSRLHPHPEHSTVSSPTCPDIQEAEDHLDLDVAQGHTPSTLSSGPYLTTSQHSQEAQNCLETQLHQRTTAMVSAPAHRGDLRDLPDVHRPPYSIRDSSARKKVLVTDRCVHLEGQLGVSPTAHISSSAKQATTAVLRM